MSLQVTNERHDEANTKGPTAWWQRRWIPLGALALVATLVLFFAYTRRGNKEEAPAPPAESSTGTVKFLMEQQWRIRMKLALVEEQTVARQVTATGRVISAANHQAIVAPPVGGIIQRGQRGNLPRVGQRVAQGQIIAVLQQTATSAEQAQVRAAQAQTQAQNTQLAIEAARLAGEQHAAAGEADAARTRLDLARKEAERARRLYEQKAYSQRQVEAAEADLRTAQAAAEAAAARLKVLEAARAVPPSSNNINIGSANASYVARAPISGFVTKVNKNIGEQVAPGEAILEVTNFDTVWVEAPIFERDLSLVRASGKASFTTPAYPDQEFRGTLVNVGEVIEEQTRAAHVIFAVPNPGRALRVGMQANVRLNAGEPVTAMMIPREAVLDNEGKKIVYVLLSGEEFERREVKLGDEYGNQVAVLEGLKSGERVVTQGALQLKLQELSPASAGEHSHET